MTQRPVPNTADHDTGGHWYAAQNGELAIQTCTACKQVLHLPKAYCHVCGSWKTQWKTVRPDGTLWSYTITERELRPGFTPPYTVIVVELDDTPHTRLIGYLPGRPRLVIGMPMRATFEYLDYETVLPQWEPA